MARTFAVEVVTPERVVLSAEAVSLRAPGIEGYLGVLGGHAPLITELGIGELTVRHPEGRTTRAAVSGGFMEVHPDKTTILADAAELAEEIDIARAEAARRRAEERLRAGGPEVDVARAQAALARAINRLRVAGER